MQQETIYFDYGKGFNVIQCRLLQLKEEKKELNSKIKELNGLYIEETGKNKKETHRRHLRNYQYRLSQCETMIHMNESFLLYDKNHSFQLEN